MVIKKYQYNPGQHLRGPFVRRHKPNQPGDSQTYYKSLLHYYDVNEAAVRFQQENYSFGELSRDEEDEFSSDPTEEEEEEENAPPGMAPGEDRADSDTAAQQGNDAGLEQAGKKYSAYFQGDVPERSYSILNQFASDSAGDSKVSGVRNLYTPQIASRQVCEQLKNRPTSRSRELARCPEGRIMEIAAEIEESPEQSANLEGKSDMSEPFQIITPPAKYNQEASSKMKKKNPSPQPTNLEAADKPLGAALQPYTSNAGGSNNRSPGWRKLTKKFARNAGKKTSLESPQGQWQLLPSQGKRNVPQDRRQTKQPTQSWQLL